MEINLVETWLKKDVSRWIAGALAGAFAGGVMLLFSVLMFSFLGEDALLPLKLPAIPFLGAEATRVGFGTNVIVGILVHEVLTIVLGVVFAHFTFTNHLYSLLGMGFTWGIFSWIFLNNLFFPAWREYFVMDVSKGGQFFACLVFGFSLSSVKVFDRLVRRPD